MGEVQTRWVWIYYDEVNIFAQFLAAKSSYSIVWQANPEWEAIHLGNEPQVCIVLHVMDACQVASKLITFDYSLRPIQLLGNNPVC